MYTGLRVKYLSFLSGFNETFNFLDSFKKYPNIKFHENTSSWNRSAPCGLSEDITKPIVALSNYANAPKN